MEAVTNFLSSEAGLNAILGVLALVFGLVKSLQWSKKRKLGIALDALEIGIRDTYQGYVKEVKASSADGKMSPQQKAKAREMAIEIAKEWAKSQGVNLMKLYAKEYLPVLVEKLVSRSKTAGGIAKTVLPFVPEPELPLQ